MTDTILDFFKIKEGAKTQEDIERLADVLYPCVEHLLDDVIRSYVTSNALYNKHREAPYVCFTTAVTLFFAASQYLDKLSKKKNEFGINQDTVSEFSHKLLDSLFKPDKNKEFHKMLKDTLNAT